MVETRTTRRSSIWFGWVTFAAVMMIILGVLNVLEGLVALLQNQVTFIDGDSLVVVDLTGLGVVMMVSGVLLLVAGIGLLARSTAARIAAIVIVALHLLSQVGSLGAYPVWSLLMITLDVVILFALTVHWADAPREIETAAPPGGMHAPHRAERDLQNRPTSFAMNAPAGAERGYPAHAAPEGPPAHQNPEAQPQPSPSQPQSSPPLHQPSQPPQHQPGAYQSPYQAPPGQPNAGPYPPAGRPGSPAHAAPTSGYGTGAI